MKSVLGLLGVSVLVFSCSGNGDVEFGDLPKGGGNGQGGTGNANAGGTSAGTKAGGSANGGSANGGSAGQGDGGGAGDPTTAGSGPVSGSGGGPNGPEVIYVATTGTDGEACGLTPDTACRSISHGAARATAAQRDSVYVQAGSYPGVALLAPGVNVIGGFDDAWQSGERSKAEHRVVIEGGLHESSKEYLAVWAHDLDSQASLQNLVILGPDAVGQKQGTRDGRSSYGVHAVAAKLLLKDVDIIAGSGAPGLAGESGQDAPVLDATQTMSGEVGQNGVVLKQVPCSVDASEGGDPGVNTCTASPSNTVMSGGRGGDGGQRDTNCVGPGNYTAQPGQAGDDAPVMQAPAGKGGNGGSGGRSGTPGACGMTAGGNPGVVVNGAAGKAKSGGKLNGDFWYALAGGDGGTGENGGGGGGGGGAGSCDTNQFGTTDIRGAAGGGGAAGGCAARAGGFGGGGGGGSFGIFAVGSNVDVSNVSITRGTGGDGGTGGLGGRGQSGGLGQSGGMAPGASALAGKGGNGGHGGHGGGGAGGSGGHAFAVLLGAGATLDGTLTAKGGAAGKGGAGGASAPTAPEAERDGNSGEAGTDGALGESLECGSGSC